MITVQQALEIAVAHHQAGRLAEAAAIYDRVLAVAPDSADAWHLSGVIRRRQGGDAAGLIRRGAALNPQLAEAYYNLGLALLAGGDAAAAAAAHDHAAVLKPAAAHHHFGLGLALASVGRRGAAAHAFAAVLARQPDHVDAGLNRGMMLKGEGRLEEAAAQYRRMLAWRPDHAVLWRALGVASNERGDGAAAVAAFTRATRIDPADRGAVHLLAATLTNLGDVAAATAALEPAVAADPRQLELRLLQCRAALPFVYDTADEISAARRRYRQLLERLAADVEADPPAVDLQGDADAGLVFLPYYLPYQGMDDRDLQETYGRIARRIIATRFPAFAAAPPLPAPGARIRVGVASAFFCRHSNWKIPIRGWIEGLDRQRFEVIGYSLGDRRDDATDMARSMFERFVEGPRTPAEWMATIRGDALHLLIYPEIGMDMLAAQLAALRLAARQATSWGHPNTSGFASIDYFISSDLMEPPDGDAFYSEKLIRLPNLSIRYGDDYCQAQNPPAHDFAAYGLEPGSVVFLCLQSLPKYLPQHDMVLARIARRTPGARFVFLGVMTDAVNQRTAARLRRAFAAEGADPAAVLMLPQLPTNAYAALQRRGDVFLDSIGWSGCNSTLEALNHGLPVVTLPGRFMRERHTLAILTMMGVTETIARDADHYVDLAVRLGGDAGFRAEMRARVQAGRKRLYDDDACIHGLETFIEDCACGRI